MPGHANLAAFAVRALLALLLLSILSLSVAGAYADAVAAASDWLTSGEVSVRTLGSHLLFGRPDVSVGLTVNGLTLQFGLVLLGALVLATVGMGAAKPLSQIHRDGCSRWAPQDTDPTPSFGGFGLTHAGRRCRRYYLGLRKRGVGVRRNGACRSQHLRDGVGAGAGRHRRDMVSRCGIQAGHPIVASGQYRKGYANVLRG